ncbi:MAG: hypothetical protein AAGE94_23220, partial [Acidobacteriota bacterium]
MLTRPAQHRLVVVALCGLTAGTLVAQPSPTVDALLDESRRAHRAMDFASAIEALDRASELATDSPETSGRVLIERSIVLRTSGALGRALAAIEQAVEQLEPTRTDRRGLAHAYRQLAEVRGRLGDDAGADLAL